MVDIPNSVEMRDVRHHMHPYINARTAGRHMPQRLTTLDDHRLVREHRGVGLIGATATDELLELDVVSRVMGDALAFCPPLITAPDQIDDLMDRTATALDRTADQLGM